MLQILDMQRGLRDHAAPGHWNDPDMLEVGNGMPVNQDRAVGRRAVSAGRLYRQG